MLNKEIILNRLENSLNSINKSEIEVSKELINKLKNTKKEVENFKFYLPLIGNYNAGKSSLINSYLEKNEFLKTEPVPETALATELYFSEKERIEAFNFDNQNSIYTIDSLDFSKVNSLNTDYLKVYLNLEVLRKKDIVIVDMPGLDSNLERHNKTLFNYMTKEVGFLLLLAAEDGTIKQSTLNFLNEVKNYRLDFFTLINKADKLLEKDMDKVYIHISKQVSKINENSFVGKTSALDDEIEDFKKLINSINIDNSIKKLFDEKSKSNVETIISNLKITKDSLSLNSEEIDKKILDLSSHIKKFSKDLTYEKRKIEEKFSQNLLTKILNNIEKKLILNIDSLVKSLKVSDDNFNQKINELIRPIIMKEIKDYSEEVFLESLNVLNKNSEDIFKDINTFANRIENIFNSLDSLEDIANQKLPSKYEILKNTIIVITQVVKEISSLLIKSDEELEAKKNEKIKIELQNNIIPSIPFQVSPSIEQSINQTKDNFFENIEQDFKTKILEVENSLKKAKEEKEIKKNELVSHQDKYNKLIFELNEILKGCL